MLNTTKKKVALIGSAPSSVQLAPYEDDSWFIMGCSPGAYPFAMKHADAWAELHRWEPQIPGHLGSGQPWFSPEYVECLVRFKGTVWMSAPVAPEILTAKAIPTEFLIEKYGPFFFTSSLAWMFALALETPGIEEIGLWGVDMSAVEEYRDQKSGCQHFITLALQRGIKVTIPPESDLLQPSVLYGITENNPMFIKLNSRMVELQNRKAQADQRMAQAQQESHFLAGAIDDLDYTMKTWVTHQQWIHPKMGKTGNEVRSPIILAGETQEEHDARREKERSVKDYDDFLAKAKVPPDRIKWVDMSEESKIAKDSDVTYLNDQAVGD